MELVEEDWIKVSLEAASGLFLQTQASCREEIMEAAQAVVDALRRGRTVLLCGNGGSAADAQHIATEMTVKMRKDRAPMPAIALTTNTSLITAQANDLGFDTVFSRQIQSFGKRGDVLIAISTSGESQNILSGAATAKDIGIKVIGLTGCGGGKLASMSDISIIVPSSDVPRIQEVHIAIGHLICDFAERKLFPE